MDALMTAGGAPLTMSSREVAELTGSTHDNVLKTIRRLVEEGVVSCNETPYRHPQNGQHYAEFLLSFRDTMVVVSGYSAQLRAKIIDRWQELEQAPRLPNLADPALLRGLLLEYTEKVLSLQSTIEKQAPMVAFANAVADAEDLQKIAVVAKALGVGPRKLLNFMKDDGVLMRDGLPFQHHLDAGRFRVIEVPYTDAQGNKRMRPATRVTARGLTFLQQRVVKARATQGA
jgi:anti-repressor protein